MPPTFCEHAEPVLEVSYESIFIPCFVIFRVVSFLALAGFPGGRICLVLDPAMVNFVSALRPSVMLPQPASHDSTSMTRDVVAGVRMQNQTT